MKKSYRIKVTGKVQNVGFRYYTVKTASEFNVNGFVKNEPDGSVYIEAEGETDAMEAFLLWCKKGPQWARVDRFDIQEQPVMSYKEFSIK